MSLKNRLTLIIISVLIITMSVLAFSSINKINTVFSLKKYSTLSSSDAPELVENSIETPDALQSFLSISRNVFNVSLLSVFIVLILISSLTIYLIVTYSLKSLNNLQIKMKNADVNSLKEPIKIVKSDPSEIKSLILNFNKMSQKLNDTFLKQQLFLHNAAHELRTPLTIISTYSQLIKMNLRKEQKNENEMIMTVLENCNYLEEMINQVLLLAEDKQVELNDVIYVEELLNKIVNEMLILSQNKKMTIKMTIPNDLYMKGNKSLLLVALRNLIENSIKYGESNSEILINIKELNKQIYFTFTNKFMNSSSIDSNKIFGAFNRGNNIDSSISGKGLGLAIVKQVSLQHSGQINFKVSDTLVIFTLVLPKRN